MLYPEIYNEIAQYVNQNDCLVLVKYIYSISKYIKKHKYNRFYQCVDKYNFHRSFINNYILSIYFTKLILYNISSLRSYIITFRNDFLKTNNVNLIKILTNIIDENDYDYDKYYTSYYYTVFYGNIRIIKYLKRIGWDGYDHGFDGACDSFIKGSETKPTIKTLKIMIDYDMELHIIGGMNGVNRYFEFLCNNKFKFFKCLVKLRPLYAAHEFPIDFNIMLSTACNHKNYKITELMIKNGATQCDHCDLPLNDHILTNRSSNPCSMM